MLERLEARTQQNQCEMDPVPKPGSKFATPLVQEFEKATKWMTILERNSTKHEEE
jgi:hypothetical protein